MAKISPRLVEETARTAGYTATIHPAGVTNIYDRHGKLTLTGYLSASGKLRLSSHDLRRQVTTISELGQALDELQQVTR